MNSDDEMALLGMLFLLDEKRRRRRMCARRIFRRRSELSEMVLVNEMRLYDEESHVAYFRMTRATFDALMSKVGPRIAHAATHTNPISVVQRLAVTLRLLATGDSQQTVGFSFRMAKSTVHQIVKETCDALIEALRDLIPEPCEASWKRIAEKFESRWNFPHCIGAIDGKHVRIKRPSNSGSLFFNYKKYFSIILLAAVDADYCFTIVDIGAAGRQSDSGVFSSSDFGRAMETGELHVPSPDEVTDLGTVPYFFVGDEAFPLKGNLQKPFPRASLTFEKKVYNYRLSRARRVSENAFGILSARWRIYHQALLVNVDLAKKYVYATILLHNFLKVQDSNTPPVFRYIPEGMLDFENSEGEVSGGQWRQSNVNIESVRQVGGRNYTPYAAEIRSRFCDFFSNAGALPWQSRIVNRGSLYTNE